MSHNVSGLASAFEPAKPREKSGVTTIASRFDTPEKQAQPQPQSRISDLASRFAGADKPAPLPSPVLPRPSGGTPFRSASAKPTPSGTPSPAGPPSVSRKVSDISKAFLEAPKEKSDTFAAAQSAFQKSSESRVSAFAGKLEGSEAGSAHVAGVARSFESRDMAAPSTVRFEKKVQREVKASAKIENKVDAFANVASRFEAGVAGRKENDQDDTGSAKDRFRDAAKMFGAS